MPIPQPYLRVYEDREGAGSAGFGLLDRPRRFIRRKVDFKLSDGLDGETRPQNPGDAIEDAPVVDAGNAARLVREHRFDDAPFAVAEFITHD